MPSPTIRKANNSAYYFISCTVVHWYYLFDRYQRWNILADSLNYCIQEKGVHVYGFVFMLNHIHILFLSSDAAGFIRDFKKFTAKQLKENIAKTEPQILKLFLEDNVFHVWQDTNMPILIESEKVFRQKLIYIHNNPVKKQYVAKPECWYWSSANSDCVITVEKMPM